MSGKADEGAAKAARSRDADCELNDSRREMAYALRQKLRADQRYAQACERFYRATVTEVDRGRRPPS